MSSKPVEVAGAAQSDDGGFGGDVVWREGFEKQGNSVGSSEVLGNTERVIDLKGTNNLESKVESSNMEDAGKSNTSAVVKESKGSFDGKRVDGDEIEPNDVEVGSNACSITDKSVGEMGKDFGKNSASIEGSQQLNPKLLNDSRFGGEMKAGIEDELLPCADKTVDGNGAMVSDSVERENQALWGETKAAMSKEESDGVHTSEGGLPGTQEVNLIVDLDECVQKDEKVSEKKDGFCTSDLVWAKVKSHPWWPGQIFEPGDASDKARRHFRSRSYLVAYFGDQTFAWNDDTKLKPFVPHFSQMVKQTSKEAFRHAVDCVLDEVSRRVEFELSCQCIAGDVYDRLKSQVVENAGIRELSSTREGGDRFLTVLSFEPVKFLGYVKSLAQESHVEVDRLEHVIAQGQMSAFYRWKGCYHLAEFRPLIGFLNNEADASNPITKGEEEISKMNDDGAVAPEGALDDHVSRPQKRKNISDHSYHSSKKVKPIPDLMIKSGLYKEDSEKQAEGKAVGTNSCLVRRGKETKFFRDGSKVVDCCPQSLGTSGTASRDSKPSFSVGESILRVAGQLSQPSPLLKLDVSSHGKSTKAKGGSKRSRRQTKVIPAEYSSGEILSELHYAAVEPLKDHSFLSSMTSFFSDFRNLNALDTYPSEKHEESVGKDDVDMFDEGPAEAAPAEMAKESAVSGSKEKASDSEITTISELGNGVDGHCPEKVVSVAVQQTSSNDLNEVAARPKPLEGGVNSTVLLKMEDAISGSEPHSRSDTVVLEKGQLDEMREQEDSPTALTLKFSDMDSIPSETTLNKIFSHFGPLKESETEVLTKKQCARVVFKRRLDAETAFSSSGKFETFGPSLVCYRLNYAPSPRKFPPVEAKRRKKNGSPVEGNTA